jgi:hypothetical protein
MSGDIELIAEDTPIACSLTAGELTTRGEEINNLFAGVQQTRELDDGYAFCFPGTSTWTQRVLDFIQGERSCCPFFTFELIFVPNQGPIWLHIRGPEGIKEMIKNMLH